MHIDGMVMHKEMKYLYLEKTMQRVPLHADNGLYVWKVGENSFEISAAAEKLLVYALFSGLPNYSFFELAKQNIPKKSVAEMNPELLYTTFKEDHPLLELMEYNYDMIPLYADSTAGMWLYNDGKGCSFWITLEEEQWLLNRLQYQQPWYCCIALLREIARKHELVLSQQALSDILESFLIQHGVDSIALKGKDNGIDNKAMATSKKRKSKKSEAEIESRLAVIFGIVCTLIITTFWTLLFCGVDIDTIILPLFSIILYYASWQYTHYNERLDWVYVFFIIAFIANFIASIVAFCIDPSGSMGFIAFLNLFLPAFVANRGRVR